MFSQKIIICLFLIFITCFAQRNWSPLDKIIQEAIADKAFPGAVAIVGDSSGILYAKSFGHFTYETTSPKMTLTVLFYKLFCNYVESI
jgi:hypothetical protein